MKLSIYNYLDYREYLRDLVKSRPSGGRGDRKHMAEALGCQQAFITHVLGGAKDFNHEQALKLAEYFNLSAPEKEYFLDLLSHNRAGTKPLREFYGRRLREKKLEREQLRTRLEEKQQLSPHDQAQYYSHWIYGAVHMASTIPALQEVGAVARYFRFDEKELEPIIAFLAGKGIVIFENGRLGPGKVNLYIGADSPLVSQMHSIWRAKVLHDLKAGRPNDLHYSLCFSAATEDWPRIREKLIEAIEGSLAVIRPSRAEKLGLLCVDFQEV